MPHDSRKVVYAALAGNIAVAISKFMVAALSGSTAMMAEAIHSTVDTGNELLLLVGMWQSRKPASPAHPFGRGREVYVWSFLVVIMMFAFGGGLSLLDGLKSIRHPQPLQSQNWAYLVLGLSALFESASFMVGIRALLSRRRKGRTVWETVRHSKDPNVMGVVFEDSAALVGLVLATVGVWSSHHFQMPQLDGGASVAIGCLMGLVAILFGREVKDLLVGEAADPEVVDWIRTVTASDPDIESAGDPVTMQLGPGQVLLNIELRFREGLDRDGIEAAIDRIEAGIRRKSPEVTRIFIEAESLKPRRDGSAAA
ncbi:MAG TPA: cation diffusion facilitator family transporter [Terracidiphilus sp.]